MATYQELKKQREEKSTKLFKECGVFWAFSKEQFEENKTELKEGEKYVSIGGGGYMPNSKAEALSDGLKEIGEWFNGEVINQGLEDSEILYELGNHECFYTGDIEQAMDALDNKYSRDRIISVYRANYDANQE